MDWRWRWRLREWEGEKWKREQEMEEMEMEESTGAGLRMARGPLSPFGTSGMDWRFAVTRNERKDQQHPKHTKESDKEERGIRRRRTRRRRSIIIITTIIISSLDNPSHLAPTTPTSHSVLRLVFLSPSSTPRNGCAGVRPSTHPGPWHLLGRACHWTSR